MLFSSLPCEYLTAHCSINSVRLNNSLDGVSMAFSMSNHFFCKDFSLV